MNCEFERKLTIPLEVKKQYPLSEGTARNIEEKRKALKAIFDGTSDKKVLIIGPCSADNEDAVLDYLERLARLQQEVSDKLMLVPRIYTGKPRTTGEGYKGMLHQPDPSGKPDVFHGILAMRHIHMKAVEQTGLICADEMLYTENYKYVDDLMGYVAIGARSVEDQQHRLTASAIEVPVGMKNPTSGDLLSMLNAIKTAQAKHSFIYRGWAVHSEGNSYAHAILRGSAQSPNYDKDTLTRLCDLYQEMDLANPAALVDTNHSNSNKDPFKQPEIVMDVLSSCNENKSIQSLVKGFMIESYIEDGCQNIGDGIYGKSITDPCLGWEKSKRLVLDIAERI